MTVDVFAHPRRMMAALAIFLLLGGCLTPVSKGYEVHTADITCDEANRLVYAALRDMRMEVTSFSPAKPGQTGALSARRESPGANLAGSVEIRCEGGRVDIVANQARDLLGDKEFERGVFLAVTGRGNLEVVRDGRYATGEVQRRPEVSVPPTQAAPVSAGKEISSVTPSEDSALTVHLEALRGFASVLDFDADLSATEVLPVKIIVRNGTRRAYDLDTGGITVGVSGSRAKVHALTLEQTQQRLARSAGGSGDGGDIGDITAAKALMAKKAFVGGRLAPGASREGFLYLPLGEYDRARLSMTDVATGESEGFVVDF